jgi:hypothetical protein
MPNGSDVGNTCGDSMNEACSLLGAQNKLINLTGSNPVPDPVDFTVLFGAEHFQVSEPIALMSLGNLNMEPAPELAGRYVYISQGPVQPDDSPPFFDAVGQHIRVSRLVFRDFLLHEVSALSMHPTKGVQVTDCHWINITKTGPEGTAGLTVYRMPEDTQIVDSSWTNCSKVGAGDQHTRDENTVAGGAFLFAFRPMPDIIDPDCTLLFRNCSFIGASPAIACLSSSGIVFVSLGF